MLGTFVLSSGYYDAYYKRAKMLQRQIAQEFAKALPRNATSLITPTYAYHRVQAWAKTSSDPLKMYAADICTVTVNIAGLPGIIGSLRRRR